MAVSFVQLVMAAVVVAVVIYPFMRIFRKAGFSPWLGVLMLVPLVNWGMLLFLAFARWPSTTEK